MKIYITGPSGGGKSTIALWLARLLEMKIYHGDEILYKFKNRERIRLVESEYGPKLMAIAKKRDWIFEGKVAYEPMMKKADWVIWLNNPFYVSLWQQWKRFVTDKDHRRKYSFGSDLALSWRIIKEQFFGRLTKDLTDNPKCVHRKKMEKLLKRYEKKLTILSRAEQIRELVIKKEMADQAEVEELGWD